MSTEMLTADRGSFTRNLGRRCSDSIARLHWMVIQSIGLKPDDILYIPIELAVFRAIPALQTVSTVRRDDGASVVFLYRPAEVDLLAAAAKLTGRRRIIAYNDEDQIDALPMKSFASASACLFDHDAKKVVRFFDGADESDDPDYLQIEIGEHGDHALSLFAAKIASLR